jgi:hypothetical protein
MTKSVNPGSRFPVQVGLNKARLSPRASTYSASQKRSICRIYKQADDLTSTAGGNIRVIKGNCLRKLERQAPSRGLPILAARDYN